MTSTLFSASGLILDIFGVLLLFKFGLPSAYVEPPKLLLGDDISEEAKKKNKKIYFWSHFGLALLILGFILQLIGVLVK